MSIVDLDENLIIICFAGSVNSLISLPCFMSHSSIPASAREARGLTEDLIRLSVSKLFLIPVFVPRIACLSFLFSCGIFWSPGWH